MSGCRLLYYLPASAACHLHAYSCWNMVIQFPITQLSTRFHRAERSDCTWDCIVCDLEDSVCFMAIPIPRCSLYMLVFSSAVEIVPLIQVSRSYTITCIDSSIQCFFNQTKGSVRNQAAYFNAAMTLPIFKNNQLYRSSCSDAWQDFYV